MSSALEGSWSNFCHISVLHAEQFCYDMALSNLIIYTGKQNTAMGKHNDVNIHTHAAESKRWCRCRDEK